MDAKKTILVIDDDPDILSSLRNTLESNNYQVNTALSGEEGLKKFNEEIPALVICDIMMEQISTGIEVVQKMREKDKNVKIYILSDIGEITNNNIDIFEIGCNGFWQKPINPDELLKNVRFLVDN